MTVKLMSLSVRALFLFGEKKKQSFSELLNGFPEFAQTLVCNPHDIVHTALAVLGVKPWEYAMFRTDAYQLPPTFRTVALSQSFA